MIRVFGGWQLHEVFNSNYLLMVITGEDQLNSPNRTSRVHPTTLRILVILIPEYSSQMVVQLVSLVIPCELADETL